jgi:hypothetical protein
VIAIEERFLAALGMTASVPLVDVLARGCVLWLLRRSVDRKSPLLQGSENKGRIEYVKVKSVKGKGLKGPRGQEYQSK